MPRVSLSDIGQPFKKATAASSSPPPAPSIRRRKSAAPGGPSNIVSISRCQSSISPGGGNWSPRHGTFDAECSSWWWYIHYLVIRSFTANPDQSGPPQFQAQGQLWPLFLVYRLSGCAQLGHKIAKIDRSKIKRSLLSTQLSQWMNVQSCGYNTSMLQSLSVYQFDLEHGPRAQSKQNFERDSFGVVLPFTWHVVSVVHV